LKNKKQSCCFGYCKRGEIVADIVVNNIKSKYSDVAIPRKLTDIYNKEQTLVKAKDDSSFFSITVSYLRNICEVIIEYVNTTRKIQVDVSDDGYAMKQIFALYDNIRDNEQSNFSKNFQNFLKSDLKWDMVEDIKIKFDTNNNIIEIRDVYEPQRNSKIFILKNELKAILRQNGKKLIEFKIKDNGTFLEFLFKTDKKNNELLDSAFYYKCTDQLIDFLTDLKTKITPSTHSYISQFLKHYLKTTNLRLH
jgi:hypothetical protein